MSVLTSEVDFALVFEPLEHSQAQENSVLLEERLGSDWMIPVIAAEFKQKLMEALEKKNLLYYHYAYYKSFESRNAS